MGIFLRRLYEDDQYARVTVYGEPLIDDAFRRIQERRCEVQSSLINIRHRGLSTVGTIYLHDRTFGVQLSLSNGLVSDTQTRNLKVIRGQLDPSSSWTIKAKPSHQRPNCVFAAVDVTKESRSLRFILFGFDDEFNPVVLLSDVGTLPAWNSRRSDWSSELAMSSNGFGQADELDDLFREYCRLNQRLTLGSYGPLGKSIVYQVDIRRPRGSTGNIWALRADRNEGLHIGLGKSRSVAGTAHISRLEIGGELTWSLSLEFARDVPPDNLDDLGPELRELDLRLKGSSGSRP